MNAKGRDSLFTGLTVSGADQADERGNSARFAPVLTHAAGRVWTTSLAVAEHFRKTHFHVLRDIDNLLEAAPAEWHASNFGCTFRYVPGPNASSRQERYYRISRDGFAILAMGFTGKRALHWKIAYVEAFNRMERELAARLAAESVSASSIPGLRLDAQLYTRLLYALGHRRSWAMLAWCLLLLGAHEAPVRASYRQLMHAMGDALSVVGLWKAMKALVQLDLVTHEPAGFRLDWGMLASLLHHVPEIADGRPGLLQEPPILALSDTGLAQSPGSTRHGPAATIEGDNP